MATRRAVRRLSLVCLTAVLLAVGAAPVARSTLSTALPALTALSALPACGTDDDPREPPETRQPSATPSGAGPSGAGPRCRARPTSVVPADSGVPQPMPGYHHLGATSAGEWSGVMGRITVRDPGVRAGSYDFVATRFMAKRQHPGKISWLEVGWAETGWSGQGRQRIYTFDTRRHAWTFYDQYPLRDGDEIWLYVHTATTPGPGPATPDVDPAHPPGPGVADPGMAGMAGTESTGPDAGASVWQAWLWWNGQWHLLAAEELPLGTSAQVEQYVEVYVDQRQGGPGFPVPRVPVNNVYVKTAPDGMLRPWTEDVPTAPGRSGERYCLDWQRRYDTWEAGDCLPATGPPPAPDRPDGNPAQPDGNPAQDQGDLPQPEDNASQHPRSQTQED